MKKTISSSLVIAYILFGSLNAETRVTDSGYSINHESGLEQDAIYIEESIEYAIEKMDTAFPFWSPRERINDIDFEVILHPKGKYLEKIRATISPGFTMINNGYDDDGYFAKLHICTPSHITDELTSMRKPMDRTYHNVLMIHEFFTVIADQISKEKEKGWHIYSAPNWFIQGLEQYVALSISENDEEIKDYIRTVQSKPSIIQTDFGLEVTQDYTGGTVLLAFICRNGNEIIKDILESTEPTFARAMTAVLDTDFPTFISEFEAWMKEQ